MTVTQAQRDLVKQHSRRLSLDYTYERHDARGPVMLAGARGMVRPVGDGLIIVLRPATFGPVEELRKQDLIRAGLLVMGRGAVMLARLPADEAEARSLRELLGLRRKAAA